MGWAVTSGEEKNTSDVLLRRGITTPLIQPRPLQAVDGVFVLDGASLCDAARSKGLERVVSEKLATDVILGVVDWQRARPRSLFCGKSVFWRSAVVGRPCRRLAWGKWERRVLKDCLVPYWWGFEKTCTRETGCLLMNLGCNPPHHRRGRYIKDRVSRVQLTKEFEQLSDFTTPRHVDGHTLCQQWDMDMVFTSTQMQINASAGDHLTLQSCFGEGLPFPHTHSFVTKDSSQQLTTRVLRDRIKELDTASQPLVRCLVISDILNSNKIDHCPRHNG